MVKMDLVFDQILWTRLNKILVDLIKKSVFYQSPITSRTNREYQSHFDEGFL